MFNFIFVWGSLLFMATCYSLSMFVLTLRILGEKPTRKSAFFYCTVYYIIQVIANSMLFLGMIDNDTFVISWNIYLYTLHVIILIFQLLWIFRQNIVRTIAAAALAHFVVFTIGSLAEEVLSSYTPKIENIYIFSTIVSILPHFIMMICSLFIALLLRKLEFGNYFKTLFTSRIRAAVTLITCLLLMHIHTIIRLLIPLQRVSMLTASYSVALIGFALFFLQFTAMYQANKERVTVQENIILQQQTHLALLGELQQEMRSFRHDFTNLMTGMTLQAREGDLQGIQDFMRNTSSYFDKRLGNEIKNLEAINRIQIPSLRSLVTSKLMQMEHAGVQANVEVLYPVHSAGMLQQDLLRSLGILLDNAFEAANISKNPRITLVLLQTEAILLISVVNSYDKPPDLVKMSHDNYTTKGENHGTGLFSLRKIIRKYPGCITNIHLKEDMFHYEISIPIYEY